jgi:hypothetical protein
MKACGVSGCIVSLIVNLGARWKWVVSLTSRPLYAQGNRPWYPLNGRPGGSQSRFGRFGEERNLSPLPRLEPRTVQPVALSLC